MHVVLLHSNGACSVNTVYIYKIDIHIYTHTYIHSHTYIHTCIHTYIHTYIRQDGRRDKPGHRECSEQKLLLQIKAEI